ncbi:TetR/AcrR family transcriptional regulator [Streptomyces caeruleatus]|uniref:TetR family transcriptional regulator n=1 Tax=Streptomyces caeruleatus TaxID=661399 RepID=A0A101THM9_9ACTN|nr:TetR/AcrR family transcriptional regulator [Streptomyces caeruleatus]KUN92528.1 TetR family transcriptional regulator [Streptomyces caeruleatus]
MASKDTDVTSSAPEQSSKPRRQSKPRPTRQSVSNGAQSRSSARRELVEKEIMEQATRLFAERGFASTTLQDIAAATGLTRPALYHYVANKDELLSRLVSEITEAPAVLLHEINERTDLSPLGKLHAMATSLALHQAESPDRFLLLVRSEAELSDDIGAKYRQNRRQVLKEFIRLIEAGIRAGEIRTVDPRTAALGIIGMLNWIAWWHRPGDPGEDKAIATELARMAVQSLAQTDGAAKVPEGPAQAIGLLRQNLDHLERLLESPHNGTAFPEEDW